MIVKQLFHLRRLKLWLLYTIYWGYKGEKKRQRASTLGSGDHIVVSQSKGCLTAGCVPSTLSWWWGEWREHTHACTLGVEEPRRQQPSVVSGGSAGFQAAERAHVHIWNVGLFRMNMKCPLGPVPSQKQS